MIKAFPKIFSLGDKRVKDIFEDPVEITEKIDGSQFVFGKVNGHLFMRSKGAIIYPENPPSMFKEAVEYVLSIKDKLKDNRIFYCEYLQNPKHNVLNYNRIPHNHLMLFGVSDETGTEFFPYPIIKSFADYLEIETVPLLYAGEIKIPEDLYRFLDKESILGGCKVEGIVIKNYFKQVFLGGVVLPIMSAKFVSEKFKEVHRNNWKNEFTTRGKWESYKESFRTEARWLKAIQHLKEKDELEFTPRDIGKLIKEILRDIIEEEKENIKDFLWKEFGEELLRNAIKGFPEFYKRYLIEQNFNKNLGE
jgi:hypothetical protein